MARSTIARIVCVLAMAAPAAAAEIVLQHDSIPPGIPVVPLLDDGTHMAAWLTAPASGHVVGVQILWGSENGGAAPSVEAAIRIGTGGVFPEPGPAVATIPSPVMLDGVTNEFRFLDPGTNLIPLSVPVTAGQVFTVDLEFEGVHPANGAGILRDDSIEPGNFSAFLPSPAIGWFELGIGLSGDVGIRAIFEPVPEPSSLVLAGMAGVIGLAMARHSRRHGALAG